MRFFRHGFSLLELILVLVILGIITSVVAVRLGPMRSAQGVAQAARALEDQCARCRHLAISRGELARLRLDLDAQTATAQVRTAEGFVAPSDGEDADFPLRSGAEAQTIAFSKDAAPSAAPGTTPSAAPLTPITAAAPAETLTTGQVDFLFYPDARCEPSGRVTFRRDADTATVVCPPAGRPAYTEGAR